MDRFWDKVDKTSDCWIWTAAKSAAGYGRFKLNGRLVSPHRLAYEMAFGDIPPGSDVCHRCDNPPCVNPEHLFVGSRSDNMQDCIAKGRFVARDRTRFCINGHDKDVVGRDAAGHCLVCSRRRKRDYMRKMRAGGTKSSTFTKAA